MSQRVVNQIVEMTGANLKKKSYVYNSIKLVSFDRSVEYEAIVNAAAEIDAEVGDDLLVWGCGKSADGYPRVAIQRLVYTDPDEADQIETYDPTPGPSGGAAVRRFFSTETHGN